MSGLVTVECKDDTDWIKCCITMEVEGVRQLGHPRNTCWDDDKQDTQSSSLSQDVAHVMNKWKKKIKWSKLLFPVYLKNGKYSNTSHSLRIKCICMHIVYYAYACSYSPVKFCKHTGHRRQLPQARAHAVHQQTLKLLF